MINIFSIGHFFQWLLIGYFLLSNWSAFFILSLAWEILELFLPFKFAIESNLNKLSDVFFNCMGFYLGNYFKNRS